MTFVRLIHSYLPHAKIIGTSTVGVIFNGEIMTDCCMVSITEFENASISTYIINTTDNNGFDLGGADLANAFGDEHVCIHSKLMLTFFSRPYNKITDFIEQFNRSAPQLQIIGGIANIQKNKNNKSAVSTVTTSFIFTEYGASTNAAACAIIDSKNMSVYSDIIYSAEPVGATHTITEADGMIIRSIDGINAIDWYSNMLGLDFKTMSTDQIERIILSFPLIRVDYSNMPWSVFISLQNKQNLVFDDEINPVLFVPSEAKAGNKIRIAYANMQKTIDKCKESYKELAKHSSEVLFGYICIQRQSLFGNYLKWELAPFKKTNLCGALVSGEIGNINYLNRYCNLAFSIASLSERSNKLRLDIDALEKNTVSLVNNNEKIIENLIKNACDKNDSRDIQQNEIEKAIFIDSDTGLWNITKCQFDYNLHAFDKICMITLRNESLLKAFMSETKFLNYFNLYHKSIMDFIDDDEYNCYIYKKTALIITASVIITDEIFKEKMITLQNVVSEFRFAEYMPASEFAIVMHEDDIIKKAELTLVQMRNKNYRFLEYTPKLGLEQYNAKKLKMTMILNDALANDLVIPYFQGIRDNRRGHIKMYEALMRIQDSEGNIYTPYQFMDIAKEYGYYADISYAMIRKVLEVFRDSTDKVTINMNISDVYNYKIVNAILKFLSTAPHPENYIFELTETEEITDYQVIFEFVQKVHQTGGKIAIDDFGSGFSNIVNLFKIESDYIKIDGEIIKNINKDIYALEFLEMISSWAKKHEKEIIAEFVENNEIQDIIEQNNIRFSQGYLYSKPSRKRDSE